MSRVILVLGAGSDIGLAYIKKLNDTATDSPVVIGQYRTMSDELKGLLELQNIEVNLIQADLGKPEEVDKMIESIKEIAECPTHILHLAATPYEFMKIKSWDAEKVKLSMEVSVYSFANVCKAFLPAMAKVKSGKVVALLSSVTQGVPPKFLSNYTLVKHALLGFVKSAAAEYAGKGITINGISPTMMETKFVSGVDERIIEMTKESSPGGRLLKVEETVDAIEYLLSDKADYINGINLNLSGGEYM